jgi:hypothetical protein
MPDKLRVIKSRADILALNDCFAAFFIEAQKAKYIPSDQWNEGDSAYLDDDDKPKILTEKQANQLNADEQQHYLDNNDDFNVKSKYQFVGQATMISGATDSASYLNALTQSFLELSKKFGKLIILGDWNTPWLRQTNDYAPAKEALEYLSKSVDSSFNGGFVLEGSEITEFIPHLFWLIRCNASMPSFKMTFGSCKTIFYLCKYGVIHIEFYAENEKTEILKFLKVLNFKSVKICSDPVYFDGLEGRRIIV